MLISTYGTVIRMPVEDFKRLGRATQGVTVMRLRGEDEVVSSLALVAEAEGPAEGAEPAVQPVPEPGEEPLTSAAEPLEPPLDELDAE